MKPALPPERAEVFWNCCRSVEEVTRAPGWRGVPNWGILKRDGVECSDDQASCPRTTVDYSH